VIKPPQFAGIEQVEVESIGEDWTTLAVRIALYNPNHVGGVLTRAEYIVFLENEIAGEGSWNGSTEIAAQDSVKLTLPLVLRDSYLPVWEQAVLGTDSVNVEAPVSLTVSTGIGKLQQEFVLDVILPLQEMVRDWAREQIDRAGIETQRVELRKVGVREHEFTVTVGFKNPFDADIIVDSLDLDVFVNATKIGTIHSQADLHLASHSPGEAKLMLRVDSLSLGSSVLSGVLHRGWDWHVVGSTRILFRELELSVPLEDTGKIIRF